MQCAPAVEPRRTHAHKEFSFCCCAALRWTTFFGLQFQMDCVGRVIALSKIHPLGPPFMMVKHGEGWGFSLESVKLEIGASMPPASQFFVAAAWFSTQVTVRLAPQAEAALAHRSHDSAPSSSSKSMLSPLA